MPKPQEPVEPTEANFAFTPFALMATVSMGPTNRFAKVGMSTYLQEVTPGTYRIYGPITALPNAAPIGVCYCMGSVQFEAKAGDITDLGVMPVSESQERPHGDSSWPGDWSKMPVLKPADGNTPLDPRLTSFRTVTASYRPAGKMPNYFGLQVARMPEMPGVMRYERDRIIDLKTVP
jgi:hypothetical protein